MKCIHKLDSVGCGTCSNPGLKYITTDFTKQMSNMPSIAMYSFSPAPPPSIKKEPTFVENEMVVTFDVDDTLILWNHPKSVDNINGVPYRIHIKHVDSLKRFHARGQYVIVWSKGGAKWAHKAVKLLGISSYVDLIMAKPSWLFDDKPLSELGDLCFDKDE